MGFLNTAPDDDEQIAAAGANGTTQAPTPDYFEGTLSGMFRGARQGAAAVEGEVADALEPSSPLMRSGGSLPELMLDEAQGADTSQPEPAWHQDFTKNRLQLEKQLDAQRAQEGGGAQAIGDLTKGLTEFAVGTAVTGGDPLGGAASMGGATADETYRNVLQQTGDENAAKEAATFQGVLAGGTALIPGVGGGIGGKLLGTAGKYLFGAATGVAVGEGVNIAAREGQAEILDANGFHSAAVAQRQFDAKQEATGVALYAALGLLGPTLEHAVPPSGLDTALASADNLRTQNAAPGIAKDAPTAAAANDAFSQTLDALANGKPVNIPRETAETIANGIVADPHQMEQIAFSHEIYGENPMVANANIMSDKVDEAYTQIGKNPAQIEMLPVEHAGNGSTFLEPDELARAEHANKVAQLVAQHGIPVEAARDMQGLLRLHERDPLTGFYTKSVHEQLLRNAIAHARETGENVHYVESDSLNMGGRNNAIGNTRTNDTLAADGHAFAQELGRAGHVIPVRHGGDEFSAIVVGARHDTDIQAALDRANARVQSSAEQAGLSELPNPHGGQGLGLVTAFKRIKGNERPRDVTEGIDAQIKAGKAEAHGQREGQAAGTGGVDAGAAKETPGKTGGEGQSGGNGAAPAEALEAPKTAPLSPSNEARLQQLETLHGHKMVEIDGERMTVAQVAQRMREEAANADSDNKALDAAVSCFLRTGGA